MIEIRDFLGGCLQVGEAHLLLEAACELCLQLFLCIEALAGEFYFADLDADGGVAAFYGAEIDLDIGFIGFRRPAAILIDVGSYGACIDGGTFCENRQRKGEQRCGQRQNYTFAQERLVQFMVPSFHIGYFTCFLYE